VSSDPDDQLNSVQKMILSGRKDPAAFIEAYMGAKLWGMQKRIVQSVFDRPRVAVRAAHSVGKTFVAARIVLAWFYLYPHSKILTTAPTFTAVRKLLWAEIAAAKAKVPKGFGGQLFGTELRADKDWWAIGLSTDSAERFQGFHSASPMLLVFDEAVGVRGEIWEAAEGIRAGGNVHMLAIANPTAVSGPFYDAFHSQRETWELMQISAFDSPNLQGLTPESILELSEQELDANPYPYLTTRRWVAEKLTEWGLGHPLWQSRVCGDFPTEREDSLVWLNWVEKAKKADLKVEEEDIWQVGIDVAGPGSDETVLCVRHGPRLMEMRSWAGSDVRGAVVNLLRNYEGKELICCVDSVGMGHYFARAIEENLPEVNVIDVNVGKRSDKPERFTNLKAQYYWGLRERFRDGEITGIWDERLVSQLCGIRYEHNVKGQVVIESKDSVRRRGGKSPDRAEALMLAFASGNRIQSGPVNLSREIFFG
jgi:phage terminase large subunit